jgi:hypothetical protein
MSDRKLNNYTNKSYETLENDVDLFLKELVPEWTSRDDNDLNWATAKAVAYLVSIGMFYIDLAYSEQDPYTLQIYKNALRLAKIKNYPAKKYIGAVTTLICHIEAKPDIFTVPRGTIFSSKYVSYEDTVFAIGETQKEVNVIYGVYNTKSLATSDGSNFQKYIIPDLDIQSGMIKIFVDGEEWTKVDNLFFSYEDEKHYKMILNEDNQYELFFGDNFNGKSPENNASITYEYVSMPANYINENYGNIPEDNIVNSSLADITLVEQNDPATGGGDKESLESVCRGVIEYPYTTARIQSPRDAEILAKRVPGVADAKCLFDGSFNVYIIPEGGGLASPALIYKVADYLDIYKIEDIDLNVLSPTYKYIDLEISINIETKYHRDTVKSIVQSLLVDYIDGSNDVSRKITIIDIYSIANVEGVDTALLDKLAFMGLTGVQNLTFNVNEICRLNSIVVNATGGFV